MRTAARRTPRPRGRAGRLGVLVFGVTSGSLLLGAAAPALDTHALTLLTLNGQEITLAEALGEGSDPTVLLVWSLYQPDSRRALRALDQLAGASELHASVLAVEVPEYREGLEVVADFLSKAAVRLPVLVDPDGALLAAAATAAGGGDRMPATYLVRPGGGVELVTARWVERYGEIVREYLVRANTAREASP